jgi:ATPase
MTNIEKLVPDTSVIVEGVVSKKIEAKEIYVDTLIIHEAVLAELEHQANQGKAIGHLGLDEIEKLRKLSEGKFQILFSGKRPSAGEIKFASLGEVDALIRQLAYEEDATLLTGDKVQAKVAKARGMKYILIEKQIKTKKIKLENFFDEATMSVHLRENTYPMAKKGKPGDWQFVQVRDSLLTKDEIKDISAEIIDEARASSDGFIEIEREGSTIIQLGLFRIVITRPAFSDGWEITAVRPVKQLSLQEYQLSEKLLKNAEKKAYQLKRKPRNL